MKRTISRKVNENLPTSEVKKLFFEENKSRLEIAEIFNTNSSSISKILGRPPYPKNKIEEIKSLHISQLQKEFIIGSTLGDASLLKRINFKNCSFKVSHCEAQKEYLLWKADFLNPFVNSVARSKDKRGNSIMYGFTSLSHQDFYPLREMFYKDKIKVVKKDIQAYLTPFALAIWFMDDGTVLRSDCRLSTDSFTYQENQLLSQMLKENFGFNVKVRKYIRNNKRFNFLSFTQPDRPKLRDLIKPFLVECMSYKLP